MFHQKLIPDGIAGLVSFGKRQFQRVIKPLVLMILLLGVLVVIPHTLALAATSDAIQSEIDDLSEQKESIQDRMDSIQAQIDSLDYERLNVLEKKRLLDEKNTLTQQELDVIGEQITIVDRLISEMQEDLDIAQENECEQRERWLTRVRAMEEGSTLSYIEVVFNATSFSDLLTRLDLVNEMMSYDEELTSEYMAARESVETLEAQAEELYALNEANRTELEEKQAQLEADIEAATALVLGMENNIDEYNATLEDERETQAEIEALIVAKEAELAAAKAAEEAARQLALTTRENTVTYISDTTDAVSEIGYDGFLWPSYTSELSSEYGYRVNPVSGVYKLHAGVDIRASYGTAVWASEGGTVILAGWNGGYGNCVMINHGDGYTTLYGHMSSISVSVGQTVTQGQTVGYVGSTGNSTGPHLHFEVRASSTGGSMDPMSFSYY